MKSYETEARERYCNTDAYREQEQKTKHYTKEKWAEANDGLMAIFAEFAACKNSDSSADSTEAQALVAKLQAHITENYHNNEKQRERDQVKNAILEKYNVPILRLSTVGSGEKQKLISALESMNVT